LPISANDLSAPVRSAIAPFFASCVRLACSWEVPLCPLCPSHTLSAQETVLPLHAAPAHPAKLWPLTCRGCCPSLLLSFPAIVRQAPACCSQANLTVLGAAAARLQLHSGRQHFATRHELLPTPERGFPPVAVADHVDCVDRHSSWVHGCRPLAVSWHAAACTSQGREGPDWYRHPPLHFRAQHGIQCRTKPHSQPLAPPCCGGSNLGPHVHPQRLSGATPHHLAAA